MDVVKRHFVLWCSILIIIMSIVPICGCLTGSKDGPSNTSTNVYIAPYEKSDENYQIIEGKYTLPTMAATPQPQEYSQFDYNYSNHYSWYPTKNDSLKILYGTYYFHLTPQRQWEDQLNVRGIYSYPYSCESGLVINDVDNNGTIYATYNNESVILKTGDVWTSPVFSIMENRTYMGIDYNVSIKKEMYYKALLNTTWTVKNLGVYNK